MQNSIIVDRLQSYKIDTTEQKINALKEIMQEIILYGLSTLNFFEQALFQGGTSLRILYGLQRFSEDLDFILKSPNPEFNWQKYISGIEQICEEFGIASKIIDKSKASSAIQKLFVKNDSIGKVLDLTLMNAETINITIKLEIDVNPPAGSLIETKYLDYPLLFAVQAQDLSSNFAGKIHALLCRKYVKGRDWYDFLWYVAKNIQPNIELLNNAIKQNGPWADQDLIMTNTWYRDTLKQKILSIDWPQAADDVARFLNTRDRQQLSLWSKDLFLEKLEKLLP